MAVSVSAAAVAACGGLLTEQKHPQPWNGLFGPPSSWLLIGVVLWSLWFYLNVYLEERLLRKKTWEEETEAKEANYLKIMYTSKANGKEGIKEKTHAASSQRTEEVATAKPASTTTAATAATAVTAPPQKQQEKQRSPRPVSQVTPDAAIAATTSQQKKKKKEEESARPTQPEQKQPRGRKEESKKAAANGASTSKSHGGQKNGDTTKQTATPASAAVTTINGSDKKKDEEKMVSVGAEVRPTAATAMTGGGGGGGGGSSSSAGKQSDQGLLRSTHPSQPKKNHSPLPPKQPAASTAPIAAASSPAPAHPVASIPQPASSSPLSSAQKEHTEPTDESGISTHPTTSLATPMPSSSLCAPKSVTDANKKDIAGSRSVTLSLSAETAASNAMASPAAGVEVPAAVKQETTTVPAVPNPTSAITGPKEASPQPAPSSVPVSVPSVAPLLSQQQPTTAVIPSEPVSSVRPIRKTRPSTTALMPPRRSSTAAEVTAADKGNSMKANGDATSTVQSNPPPTPVEEATVKSLPEAEKPAVEMDPASEAKADLPFEIQVLSISRSPRETTVNSEERSKETTEISENGLSNSAHESQEKSYKQRLFRRATNPSLSSTYGRSNTPASRRVSGTGAGSKVGADGVKTIKTTAVNGTSLDGVSGEEGSNVLLSQGNTRIAGGEIPMWKVAKPPAGTTSGWGILLQIRTMLSMYNSTNF